MQHKERYRKQAIYRLFLLERLSVNLLPEIIQLIRYWTFRSYHIKGILRTLGHKAIRPIELCCYSPLPIALLESRPRFNVLFPMLNITLEKGKCGLMVSMTIPGRQLPLCCHWDDIEETPLGDVFKCMIDNAKR
jgi:hypothetical protein